MTQELVVWVLLAGLIGLLWVMTCAILTKDQPAAYASEDAEHDREADQVERHSSSKRTVAV